MSNQKDGPTPNASRDPASSASSSRPRKTLGLTGITINAMALIAPGAFMFLLFQSQAAGLIAGSADIWPGVLGALLIALITAQSLGELARRYPEAGLRGAYHFADHVFRDLAPSNRRSWIPAAKLIIGWASHLYYWLYPGVMVAFTGTLATYVFRQFGYQPTWFGQLLLTLSFSALIGFLALRGITGSTTSSVVLNVIQLALLLFFCVTAILFRFLNPLQIPASGWIHPDIASIVLPKSVAGLVFQSALAMILMIGFEASIALGASAKNPARDIPRASVLALVIQGAFAYLLEYFTANLALNHQLAAENGRWNGIDALIHSRVPIGDLILQIGNSLLNGNGSAVLLAISLAILVALLGSTLTALNTSVRTSFSMAMDKDMPSMLSFFKPQYTTPYYTVLIIGGLSAVIGSAAALGGLPVLMGIILAANLGALLLYAGLCGLTIAAFYKTPEFHFGRHILRPGIGLAVNLAVVIAFPIIGIQSGGVPAQASLLALGIAFFWLLASLAYYRTTQTR